MNEKIVFTEKEGKVYFSIPSNPELEAKVRAAIKKQSSPLSKAHFFKRGIRDAVNHILTGEPRKYGTPIVRVTDPFTREETDMPCHDAKSLLNDVGGCYYIEHVGGSNLPKNYFQQ